jgi:hypothetical protein
MAITPSCRARSMPSLILKRASISRPAGEWNDDDFDVLADGAVAGRIFHAAASPVDVDPSVWAPRRPHTDPRLRGDARGRDGSVREKLGNGYGIVRRRHIRFRRQTGEHLLSPSFTGFDPERSSGAFTRLAYGSH